MKTTSERCLALVTATLLVAWAGAAAAQSGELGRLFMTPQERGMLEQKRRFVPGPEQQPEPEPEPEIADVLPESLPEVGDIQVSGVVTRSSGNNTAWVNGINSLDGDFEAQHIRVQPNGVRSSGVDIDIPSQRRHVRLKPGQVYQTESATVVDAYDASAPRHSTD